MFLTLLSVFVGFCGDNAAQLTETQKIEMLIKHVGELKDTVFIRNGKEHDAKAAAEHLRKKWDYAKKEIKTAREFVEKIATKSYLGGEFYRIRFKDGREVKSGEYLLERLKEIENPPKPSGGSGA